MRQLSFVALRAAGLAWRISRSGHPTGLAHPLPRRQIYSTILAAWPDSVFTHLELYGVLEAAELVERDEIAGDFVECGVLRGGSAAMLAMGMCAGDTTRTLWLFDSFEGLSSPSPPPRPKDPTRGLRWLPDPERFYPSEEAMWRVLSLTPLPRTRIRLGRGWFDATLPRAEIRQVALLNVDLHEYEPSRYCFEHFHERLTPGALVLLGGYLNAPYMKALEDYRAAHSLPIVIERPRGMTPYFRFPG